MVWLCRNIVLCAYIVTVVLDPDPTRRLKTKNVEHVNRKLRLVRFEAIRGDIYTLTLNMYIIINLMHMYLTLRIYIYLNDPLSL